MTLQYAQPPSLNRARERAGAHTGLQTSSPAAGAGRCGAALDSSWSGLSTDIAPGGLPGDRQARLAARRAFVALKQSFLYAVEGLEGKTELQSRVRQAEEPEELWQLRAPVFAALAGADASTRSRRQLLNRSLESMFPPVAQPFG